MARQLIPPDKLRVDPHALWGEQWFLLTCGDFEAGHSNTMTVAWGSFGTMWSKPFAQIVVRPVRYTFEFLEQYDTFTLSAFAEAQRPALQLLGSKSGRDGDKISETGLTPVASTKVTSPAFEEAELIVECRKMYAQDMDPACFVDAELDKNYPKKDYHRIYYGEIVAAHGEETYIS